MRRPKSENNCVASVSAQTKEKKKDTWIEKREKNKWTLSFDFVCVRQISTQPHFIRFTEAADRIPISTGTTLL